MKVASSRKPESFVWTVNEIKLLLRLTLNCKSGKLQERHEHKHVVRCCCCYETSWGSEVGGKRSRWWCHRFGKYADLLSTQKHKGSVFQIFPPWDLVSKKCIFRHCVYRIHVDDWPKRCKTCVFTLKSVSIWTGCRCGDSREEVHFLMLALHSFLSESLNGMFVTCFGQKKLKDWAQQGSWNTSFCSRWPVWVPFPLNANELLCAPPKDNSIALPTSSCIVEHVRMASCDHGNGWVCGSNGCRTCLTRSLIQNNKRRQKKVSCREWTWMFLNG